MNIEKIKSVGGYHEPFASSLDKITFGTRTALNTVYKSDTNKQIKLHSSSWNTMKSTIVGILLLKLVNACDVTLYMNYDNVTMMCDMNDCDTFPQRPLHLKVGQKICIKDHSGGEVSLNLADITYTFRYELAYFTSNFTIVTWETAGECCSPGSVCRPSDSDCYSDGEYMHEIRYLRQCVNVEYPYPTQGVNCFQKYEKQQEGELYQVYTHVETFWKANFTLTQNNNVQESIIDEFSPILDLTDFRLEKVDKLLSLAVLHDELPEKSFNALLLYEDKYYFVSASGVNDPLTGFFGDFQVSLDKTQISYFKQPSLLNSCNAVVHRDYYTSKINCSCSCNLENEIRMMSKLIEKRETFQFAENILLRKSDGSVIDVMEKLNTSTLTIKPASDRKEEKQMIKRGKCVAEFLTTFRTFSRNKTSYVVVLQFKNVTTRGLVPFFSNCSFDKDYLPCDYSLFSLKLMSNHHICHVYIPTLNKSMKITMDQFEPAHWCELVKKGNCTMNSDAYENWKYFAIIFSKTVIFCLLFGLFVTSVAGIFSSFKRQGRTGTEPTSVEL